MLINEQDKARFASKLSIGDADQCWEWQAARFENGYGVFKLNSRVQRAHRISYEIFHKEIVPEHMQALHRCDNRLCCNPSHLFLGTQYDNMQDMIVKKRKTNGERHKSSKLTDEDVLAIKCDHKLNGGSMFTKDLTAKYCVSAVTVLGIVHGTVRKTPTNPAIN